MRVARWLDHLPPWLSCGALAATEVFEPGEVAGMAAPLVVAAFVEARRVDLSRWQRFVEIAALGFILLDAYRRPGLIPVVVHALFLLCAARLILPREYAQRKQILLMAFLLFLVTSLTAPDLSFILWGLAWTAAAAGVLLQVAWEQSAHYRRGPLLHPPFRRLLPWTLASLLMAAAFFVLLPRAALGMRPFAWGINSLGFGQAGFSDHLDLTGGGTIAPNADVVIRILPTKPLPPMMREAVGAKLSLLRGLALERFDGRQWKSSDLQWHRTYGLWSPYHRPGREGVHLAFHFSPTPGGILPLPYGGLDLSPPLGQRLQHEYSSGTIKWTFPVQNRQALDVILDLDTPILDEPAPRSRNLGPLTYLDDKAVLARKWSELLAPGNPSTQELASRLTGELRSRFSYTLENPSGKAKDPLTDFLENSRAGHCEYFASAMALMLRARGVPARVANGYRLGPWIAEGGYWLVTQNEAHSWVEYHDPERGWCLADPTPPAPPSSVLSSTFTAFLGRWMDAARFKWDRHVVGFSGDDQEAGFSWIQTKIAGFRLPDIRTLKRALVSPKGLETILVPIFLVWIAWRTRSWWLRLLAVGPPPKGLAALKPLLRRAGPDLEPEEGETARNWLLRLAEAHPERTVPLRDLATLTDAVAYGNGPLAYLRERIRQEVRYWK